jgi:guanylate kinase
MPKFVIAFVVPSKENLLKHKIVEGEDKDAALKTFFAQEVSEYYSNDEQGYYYFKEDFADPNVASGSILQLD